MFDEPFELTKQFRYQDEYDSMHNIQSWPKRLINFDNGTIFRRTPMQWLILVCFYVLFFSGIALYWSLCYWVFTITLNDDRPKYLLSQPGFSFAPDFSYGSKIEFHEKSATDINEILHHLKLALTNYGQLPAKQHFGDCQSENSYGYRERKPCIFLKINRIIGFKADTIKSVTDLPLDAPRELRIYIKELQPEERKNRIWVSCESRPMLSFNYYPHRYYLATNVNWPKAKTAAFRKLDDQRLFNESDFQRIIALQVNNVRPNIEYNLHCVLWAKNVQRDYKGKMGRGVVRFGLHIKS